MTDILLELGCRAALGIAVLVYEEYQKPDNTNNNNNHRNATTTRVTPQQVNEMNENRSSTRTPTNNKNKSFLSSIGSAVSDHVIDPLSRLSKYLFSSTKSRAIVCIFGLQGSGKTTLLEFISGVKQNNGIDPRDLCDSTISASTTLGFNAETISKQILQSTFFSKKEQEEARRNKKDSFLNSNFIFGGTGTEQKKIDEVCFFDVGGSDKIRPLWSKFLDNGNCDAIIYVVDASNRATMDQAAQEFQDKIVNFYLTSTNIRSPKAILILATHSDLNDVMLTREIGQKLNIEEVADKLKCSWFVQGCSLVRRETLYARVNEEFDYGRCLGVHDGMNWLLKRVL